MDRVLRSITVADPGEGPGGAATRLVLDQTEALRAEKDFFPDHPPLSKVQDDRLPLTYLRVWNTVKLVIEGQLHQTPNRGDR